MATPTTPNIPVRYDSRSFIINDKRQLLIMGEIHYSRSPRELWPDILDRSVACGINSVATYVFWNWHEGQRNCYDFSGDRDLGHFLELCAERNLHVLLRMGPYCCGEWNYGGFPPWLREEPGITIRTWSKPYLDRVEKYFRHLCAEVRPYLITNGGPIILAQVENEYANVALRYGEDGERYLRWMADLARALGIDVPLMMCEGAAEGVIETVNGHGINAGRVAEFREKHADLPMVWTELWPSWYDTWGFQHHRRDARNIAWNILRFLQDGGAGWNYYMWHGGTNFGRNSMYLQTTSYDFDAPLDEFGAISEKGAYLARLHQLISDNARLLLEGDLQQEKSGKVTRVSWRMPGEELAIELQPGNEGHVWYNGHMLFNIAADFQKVEQNFPLSAWQAFSPITDWKHTHEPRPSMLLPEYENIEPLEQLSLTQDESDYCWYSTTLQTENSGKHQLVVERGGDLLYIYINDDLVAQSQPPFTENRGRPAPDVDPFIPANELESERGDGYLQTFTFSAPAGEYNLDILAVSLGLVKGDWQLAGSMQTERKGIWGKVTFDGEHLQQWVMRPGLVGELIKLPVMPGLAHNALPCMWFEGYFSLPKELKNEKISVRLDASGLGKGLIWLNDKLLGRHWLITADGYGPDKPWHFREDHGMYLGAAGIPTQRYYHIPACWLEDDNTLRIFEEQPCQPTRVVLQYRLENNGV